MKPYIAVICYTDYNRYGSHSHTVPILYTHSIEIAGGLPFILPFTRNLDLIPAMLEMADGYLFTGGVDIDPTRYNETPLCDSHSIDQELDCFQFKAFDVAFKSGKPILAICRGAQLANVALGGTLCQDILTQLPGPLHKHSGEEDQAGEDHEIHIEPGSDLFNIFGSTAWVNSRHHQSIQRLGANLIVTARASDGVIEAAEHAELPISLVQWHPELMMQDDDSMLPLFKSLVEKCDS